MRGVKPLIETNKENDYFFSDQNFSAGSGVGINLYIGYSEGDIRNNYQKDGFNYFEYSKTAFDDSVQFWQAGKGDGNIKSVKSVAEVVKEFAAVNV